MTRRNLARHAALDDLADLPFVERVEVHPATDVGRLAHPNDAEAVVRTAAGTTRFRLEVKRTHLTQAIADGVAARARANDRRDVLLVAPYVPPTIGERLAEAGVNYVDEAGNYRLAIGTQYFAAREGRKPARRPPGVQGTRLAGFKVIFTLLARPDHLRLPVRELAAKAGVGKTAAADALNRLAAQGLVGKGPNRRLLDRRGLMDRWLAGYATTVRPRLFAGAYRTRHPDPPALEAEIERAAPPTPWAFGGAAAAHRLTHYYRGATTVLHLDDRPLPRFLHEIGALPADDGNLIVLGIPGPAGFEGVEPNLVHPLLVYTELYAEHDDRAREAARVLAAEYLRDVI